MVIINLRVQIFYWIWKFNPRHERLNGVIPYHAPCFCEPTQLVGEIPKGSQARSPESRFEVVDAMKTTLRPPMSRQHFFPRENVAVAFSRWILTVVLSALTCLIWTVVLPVFYFAMR